jgi:hypothetical protein
MEGLGREVMPMQPLLYRQKQARKEQVRVNRENLLGPASRLPDMYGYAHHLILLNIHSQSKLTLQQSAVSYFIAYSMGKFLMGA